MSEPLTVRVFENKALQYTAECPGPVLLGRDRGGETPGHTSPAEDGTRFVIAAVQETSVARYQARIEPLAGERIRLTNTSSKVPIGLPNGPLLPPCGSCELPLPVVLSLGSKVVRVQQGEGDSEPDGLS